MPLFFGVFSFHCAALCADLQGCAEDPLSAGTTQSLFHVPSSLGRGLPVYQYGHLGLSKAPFQLLSILGPGDGSSLLSGAPSSESPHLQHEEPGAQGCSEETV